ncbi:hypothetical protein OAA18_00545 [bacterium]|nr:hypothetical protein [bacterium]
MNERKLTKSELAKREDIIMKMKKNKRSLVQKYGKDAEAVMYGRATNLAKKQAESMDQDKIKELVKDALQNPKKADLNKDGKLSDYEKKRGAAIEKSMVKEWGSSDQSIMNQSIHRDLGEPKEFPGLSQIIFAAESAVDFYWDDWDEYQTDRDGLIMHAAQLYANKMFPDFMAGMRKMFAPMDEVTDINDPVLMKMRAAKMKAANAGDDGNDKFFAKNAKRLSQLKALKDKRAQIMSDMEQEAELEGGPIADRYGDMLNKLDKAIAMLQGHGEWGPERDTDISAQEIAKRAAMMGLEEGFYGSSDIEDVTNALGYSDVYEFFQDNPGAVDALMDWVESIPEFGKMLRDANLNEDLDLGHQDDEPHMLKADLYRIGKYAMELYQMVDRFEEGSEEVDFPHWWQSKVIKAKDMLVSAKHYLDFEIKEPQIDAMVDVAAEEDVVDEPLNEGVWSLGSANEIKDAIHTLEMWYELDARQISALFDDKDNSNFFYNIVGDDLFHDYLNRVESASASDNIDSAHNAVGDAIGRAEELLAFVQKREGLNEEEAGEADMVASDIQKAMNAVKGDESKTHQLKQARIAMNKGDLEKAKKIASRIAKQLKSK